MIDHNHIRGNNAEHCNREAQRSIISTFVASAISCDKIVPPCKQVFETKNNVSGKYNHIDSFIVAGVVLSFKPKVTTASNDNLRSFWK